MDILDRLSRLSNSSSRCRASLSDSDGMSSESLREILFILQYLLRYSFTYFLDSIGIYLEAGLVHQVTGLGQWNLYIIIQIHKPCLFDHRLQLLKALIRYIYVSCAVEFEICLISFPSWLVRELTSDEFKVMRKIWESQMLQ